MKLAAVIIIFSVFLFCLPAYSADSDWEWSFFGITKKHFEGRKILPMIGGVIVSFATHEAGHIIAARLTGMDPSVKWDNGIKITAHDYYDKSDSKKALYHGGGFLAQTIVGTVLTIIPQTRHSDFVLGFTSFTMVNSILYGTVDIQDSKYSDVKNLDRLNYNGNAIAIGAGIYSGMLSYINLKKPIRK